MLGTNLKQKNNIFIKNCIDFCEYYIHFFINIFIVSLYYILLAYASELSSYFLFYFNDTYDYNKFLK